MWKCRFQITRKEIFGYKVSVSSFQGLGGSTQHQTSIRPHCSFTSTFRMQNFVFYLSFPVNADPELSKLFEISVSLLFSCFCLPVVVLFLFFFFYSSNLAFVKRLLNGFHLGLKPLCLLSGSLFFMVNLDSARGKPVDSWRIQKYSWEWLLHHDLSKLICETLINTSTSHEQDRCRFVLTRRRLAGWRGPRGGSDGLWWSGFTPPCLCPGLDFSMNHFSSHHRVWLSYQIAAGVLAKRHFIC